MAHSPRYEVRLDAAWRDVIASLGVLCAALKTAPPAARRKALLAVVRALRATPGLTREPVVKAILAEVRRAAKGTARR